MADDLSAQKAAPARTSTDTATTSSPVTWPGRPDEKLLQEVSEVRRLYVDNIVNRKINDRHGECSNAEITEWENDAHRRWREKFPTLAGWNDSEGGTEMPDDPSVMAAPRCAHVYPHGRTCGLPADVHSTVRTGGTHDFTPDDLSAQKATGKPLVCPYCGGPIGIVQLIEDDPLTIQCDNDRECDAAWNADGDVVRLPKGERNVR